MIQPNKKAINTTLPVSMSARVKICVISRVYFLDGQVVQEHAWLCENRGSKLHVSCLISHDLDMETSRSFISVL